jgi:hypothetical protein
MPEGLISASPACGSDRLPYSAGSTPARSSPYA